MTLSKKYSLSTVLTDQQIKLARLFAEGKSSKEIAAELNLSTKTVESRRCNIYRRTNSHKVQDLIRWLMNANLFSVLKEGPPLLEAATRDFERLIRAVKAVYFAAHWSPDRRVIDATGLWTELRDASGIEPGSARRLLGLPMTLTGTAAETVHVVTDSRDGKLNAIFFDEETAIAYATKNGNHKHVNAWAVHRTLDTLGPRAPFLPEGVTASELPDPEHYGLDRPQRGGR